MREALFHRAIADVSLPAPHPRFGVYRNNVAAALINALRVRYPVVEKLAGGRMFAAITQDFIVAHRPRSPVFIDYGDAYPDFIASRTAMPYLADVARLESRWWRAYHAADAEPLAAERFAELTPKTLDAARFRFHPSASIMNSQWAIGAIWEAARQDADLSAIDMARPQWVLVWRPDADVRMHVIDDATGRFLTAIMDGKGLVEAIGADGPSGSQGQFQMLIASRLVTAIGTKLQ